jgi:hypothetical protein
MIRWFSSCLICFVILTACVSEAPETVDIQPSQVVEESTSTPLPVETIVPTETNPGNPENVDLCPGEETNQIGQSIAEDYEDVEYQEIMNWFCSGAAFEDIVVALETESLTGKAVEDLLKMVADGYTWEEIWFLEGLE